LINTSMDTSRDILLLFGTVTDSVHNHKYIDFLFSRLPLDRFVVSSPLDSKQRGPYGCFQARSPEKTKEFYDKLRNENVITSLREGKIRVSPYVYNSERDIDRLISVITV